MLSLAYRELARRPAELVLLLGDTYTVPVFSMAARHHGIPLAHLEAGMRSFNQTSMEEVNRRIAGATASLHLAATPSDARFLEAEGALPERIRVVGNPVIDAVRGMGVERVAVRDRRGVVVTVHRRGNVDAPERLSAVVDLLRRLAAELPPVTFPVHPRTRARLEEAGALADLTGRGIRLTPPVPYPEMLRLVAGARVVVTDSGGIQEEASWFGVPLVVLRRSTPRWEGVRRGIAVLSGLDVEMALAATRRLSTDDEQRRIATVPCPYGDGHTAERVADLLRDSSVIALLRLAEPDFVGTAVPP
jgi:UDP-N-acetylglucosamine 2-epimerase (non-hydrolysing)